MESVTLYGNSDLSQVRQSLQCFKALLTLGLFLMHSSIINASFLSLWSHVRLLFVLLLDRLENMKKHNMTPLSSTYLGLCAICDTDGGFYFENAPQEAALIVLCYLCDAGVKVKPPHHSHQNRCCCPAPGSLSSSSSSSHRPLF